MSTKENILTYQKPARKSYLKGSGTSSTGEGLLDIQIQLGDGILTFADIRNLKAAVLLQKLQRPPSLCLYGRGRKYNNISVFLPSFLPRRRPRTSG